MSARKVWIAVIIVLACSFAGFAQTEPNLENGFKPYGSYSGSNIDTINLENGNLMVTIPMPFALPQRGKVQPSYFLGITSKTWSKSCISTACSWMPGYVSGGAAPLPLATGLAFENSMDLAVTRKTHTVIDTVDSGLNVFTEMVTGVATPDGATHKAWGMNNSITTDVTGYLVTESNPDANGINQTVVIRDRAGNMYATGGYHNASCTTSTQTVEDPNNPGHFGNINTSDCTQVARTTSVTDTNGNQITFGGTDTMNRAITLQGFTGTVSTTDFSRCVTPPTQPVSSATISNYVGFNGATNQVEVCYSNLNLATNFGLSSTTEWPPAGGGPAANVIVSVIFLFDGSTWSFQYDSYGNLTYIGLPLGGNIQYTWQTHSFPNCPAGAPATPNVSRAVTQRVITDNNGNSYTWNYQYAINGNVLCAAGLVNKMTDSLGNDTVSTFNQLQSVNNGLNDNPAPFYVTTTQNYQGTQGAGVLLKQEDTQYYSNGTGNNNVANGFVTQIATTINGHVSVVTRTPDSGGYGQGMPIFGVVTTEKKYDFTGAMLRETDTSYMWQGTGQTAQQYLAANLIGLPATIQVKDAGGNICAETDNGFDDPNGLVSYTGAFNQVAAPNPVRGNLTSVGRKLSNTACSITAATPSVTSTTKWYDTGEVQQSTDPMGHTTTHSYDSLYYGAYPTQTCAPQTGAVTHCVKGTYDAGTGLITSFTDANNQTSTFGYDNEGRMKSAIAPADLAGLHPETDFNYPDLITFQRTKKQDTTHSMVDYTYFDGLGRTKQTRLVDPEGDDFVEPTYDGLGHVVTTPNPHRAVTSSTDGKTTTYYDALGRAVQVAPQDGTLLPAGTPVTQCQINNICTDYSNFPTVTTTDQTGRMRRTRTDALGRLVEVDEPGIGSNMPGSPGSGSINVSGTLTGGYATGSVTVTGTVQSLFITVCNDTCIRQRENDPGGTVTITVNGHSDSVPYGPGSSATSVGNALITQINGDGAAVVTANTTLSCSDNTHCTIGLQARTPGQNYSVSAQGLSNDEADGFTSFDATSASGSALTGGTFDSGTLTVTVSGFQASASYNQTTNNTSTAMASALASALNASGSPVTASASGTTVTITAQTVGTPTNYTVSGSSTASFAASSTTLANGTNPGGLYTPYVTTYSYDPLCNLLSANQAGDGSQAARVRTFTYDTLSRLLTSTNPESGTVTYTYDNDGNMITKTDARSITINYSPSGFAIDGLHRVLKKTYSNGDPAVTFTYDHGTNANGRLSSAAVGSITRSFTYDPLGRVVSQIDCLPSGCKTTSVPNTGYNLASELVSLVYPDGRNVTAGFNTAGRLTGVNLAAFNGTQVNLPYYTVPQSTQASAWGYLPTGTMNRGNYGNGLIETVGYNNRLQVGSITDIKGATTLFSKSYDYYDASGHNNGNVLTITDGLSSAKNQTYTYDQLNRIATAAETDNAFSLTFTIDPWGNRKESGTSNFNQLFDTKNRIQGWSYDAAGNLLNDSTHSYTYDAESRIKTVDSTAATYTYGPGGERVRKDTAAGSTEYIYFGGVFAEFTPATGAWTDYIFASGKRIAKDTSNNGYGAQYYQGDHLGSTRLMTDASGTVISNCTYAPYGEQVGCSPDNISNHYRLTGKERDPETGIDYFGARYYGSGLGRFMTPDWSAEPATVPYAHLETPQTLNLYAYVDNNPINGIDADGHSRNEYMVAGGAYGPNIINSYSGPYNYDFTSADNQTEAEENSLNAPTPQSQQPPSQSQPSQLPLPFGPRPAACQGVSADDLEYDTPTPWTRADGSHDTGAEHIYQYHITGDPLTKSQYSSEYMGKKPPQVMLPIVVGYNADTFMFGDAVQSTLKNGKPGNITFTYRMQVYPVDLPQNVRIGGIGRLPGGKVTPYNTLVLAPDCKFVITSYPGLSGFGGVP